MLKEESFLLVSTKSSKGLKQNKTKTDAKFSHIL